MDVRVRGHHMQVESPLMECVDHHLRCSLSRVADRIRSAEVLIDDINGPRGGVDKRCRILLQIVPTGTVVAYGDDADAPVAAARATERVTRAVIRMLKRRRMLRRRGIPVQSRQ